MSLFSPAFLLFFSRRNLREYTSTPDNFFLPDVLPMRSLIDASPAQPAFDHAAKF
jgi:hypothetical protein